MGVPKKNCFVKVTLLSQVKNVGGRGYSSKVEFKTALLLNDKQTWAKTGAGLPSMLSRVRFSKRVKSAQEVGWPKGLWLPLSLFLLLSPMSLRALLFYCCRHLQSFWFLYIIYCSNWCRCDHEFPSMKSHGKQSSKHVFLLPVKRTKLAETYATQELQKEHIFMIDVSQDGGWGGFPQMFSLVNPIW